jgi:hypothetical protein
MVDLRLQRDSQEACLQNRCSEVSPQARAAVSLSDEDYSQKKQTKIVIKIRKLLTPIVTCVVVAGMSADGVRL